MLKEQSFRPLPLCPRIAVYSIYAPVPFIVPLSCPVLLHLLGCQAPLVQDRAKQKPSGHDDGNADDPGGNERMAKTSVSFAGQLRGPALDGGEGRWLGYRAAFCLRTLMKLLTYPFLSPTAATIGVISGIGISEVPGLIRMLTSIPTSLRFTLPNRWMSSVETFRTDTPRRVTSDASFHAPLRL